jgi:hypothetical protein
MMVGTMMIGVKRLWISGGILIFGVSGNLNLELLISGKQVLSTR